MNRPEDEAMVRRALEAFDAGLTARDARAAAEFAEDAIFETPRAFRLEPLLPFAPRLPADAVARAQNAHRLSASKALRNELDLRIHN